jgi:hypothetical protein
MHDLRQERHYLITIGHHTLADIQSCSLVNRVQVSLPPVNIPGFQIRSSEHYCTDTLPLFPPILPEPGFDECSLLFAKLPWAKPKQWDGYLISKIDKFDYWH